MAQQYKSALYAFILSLAYTCMVYPSSDAATLQPEITIESSETQSQELLKKLFDQELKITIALDTILSDILIQCGNATIRTKNPYAHIAGISQVRDTIEQKVAQAQGRLLIDSTVFSLPDVALLTHFNTALLSAVDELINANFEQPIALTIKRSLPDEESIDLPFLQEECAENAASFEEIQSLAASAGLSWYNKLYRTIRPYTVAPAQRHTLLLETTAAVTVMAAYLLHQTPSNSLNNALLKRLKGPLGDAPTRIEHALTENGPTTTIVDDPSTANGKLGQAIAWLNRFMGMNDPIGSKLFNAVWGSCAAGYIYARPHIAEKFTQFDNFLLGGVHRKQNTLSAYIPKTRLHDIVGMETEKQQAELLIQSIIEPEKFARSGATPPATVLFIGGSRAGKTYFAEAIGGEIAKRTGNDAFFLKVRPGHITEFGFEGLIFQAQCYNIRVLFIDEFHRYFKNGGNQDMLNGALTALNQNYDPKNPVIIICATNDPASLPHDLRNRFEVIVRFGKTTLNDRATYLERELHKSGIKLDEHSFAQLVHETQNCSFETLQRLIKSAKRDALADKKAVSQEHIWRAFDKEIRGIIVDDSKQISPATEVVIAANIAAETLLRFVMENSLDEEVSVATTLAYNASIQEASLQEQWWATTEAAHDHKRYGKVFTRGLFDITDAVSFEQQNARCKALIAGYAGEKLFKGTCGYAYRPELYNQALKIALGIVGRGINLQEVSPEVRAQHEREALEYLKKLEAEVIQTLQEHTTEFSVLMLALRDCKLLYREQLLMLMDKEVAQKILDDFQREVADNDEKSAKSSSSIVDAQPDGLEVVVPQAHE